MIAVTIHSVQKNSQTCWWTVSKSPSHQGAVKPEDCPLLGYTLLTVTIHSGVTAFTSVSSVQSVNSAILEMQAM